MSVSVRKKAGLSVLVLWGTLLAVILTLLLLVPGAMLLHKQVVPEEFGGLLSACAAGLSLFAAVVIFGRNRKTVPVTGGLVLAAYLVLLILIGLCVCGGGIWGEGLARQGLAAVAGAAIGIMVSMRRNKHRKRRGGR